MKNKLYSLCLASVLAVSMFPAAHAAKPDDTFHQELSRLVNSRDSSGYFGTMELTIGSNHLQLDGVEQQLDAPAAIRNNRTMLPIRVVAEAVGAEVDWDPSSATVIITTASGDQILCPVGSSSMTVNEASYELDSPAFVDSISNRTYLPLKAVAQALDLEVSWEGETSTVSLSAPYQTARVLVWNETHRALDEPQASDILWDGGSLYVLQYDTPAQAREAAERLQSRGFQAQPDLYIAPEAEKNASSFRANSRSWGVEACHFDSFLNEHGDQLTGTGVVAVIDTGVDADHEFLKGRVLPGIDYVDGDNDADDGHYHGTHVAGTILDCVGNTAVKILPIRVLDSRGAGYTSAIVSGIKYAADQGADVLNLSLGGVRSSCDLEEKALEYAVQRGVLAAIAAGNDNNDTSVYTPAYVTTPGTLIVSAGGSSFQKASFSNYGQNVDLMAPGVDILAAIPGNRYEKLSGTSMSAPHVAAAGVLLDMLWDQTLSPSELEAKVQAASSNGVWRDAYTGFGFLDMSRAPIPSYDPPAPAPAPAPEPSPEPDQPAPAPDPGWSEVVRYEYDSGDICVLEGGQSKLKVLAVLTNGSKVDVTEQAKLYSTDPNVVSVDHDGTITALAPGCALISMGAVPNSIAVPAPITVVVLPADPGTAPEEHFVRLYWQIGQTMDTGLAVTLTKGHSLQVDILGETADGRTVNLTDQCQPYSSDDQIAHFADGILTGVSDGSVFLWLKESPNNGLILPPILQIQVRG